MSDFELMKSISFASPSKIMLLVLDGLGGLPDPQTGKTELETAQTPNLDQLASKGLCGLINPVGPGITPGSAPGHLALFGYDPVSFIIGRGALEAIGIGFELEPSDVAVRGNFCTVDEKGLITDRRAGRIPTEKCVELCQLLDGKVIDGVKLFVSPVREHRFVIVFRGEGLNPDIADTDPQKTGSAPKPVTAASPKAERLAAVASQFVEQARNELAGHHPANMMLLRGFAQRPHWPSMSDIYKLKPAAIAGYPMYRGLAKLAGMDILETEAKLENELAVLKENYNKYDFFFMHVKQTDSAGEDGDFGRKVSVIEQVDQAVPELVRLEPDVIVVTGDHSTPAVLAGHSWHPVPMLLHSRWCRPDTAKQFGESACLTGGFGCFPATQIMSLAMAHALKLTKFGA